MRNVKHAFDVQIVEVPVDRILSGSPLSKTMLSSSKCKTIFSSIAELGVIEPLAVFPSKAQSGFYDLLDGRLRLEALRSLSRETAPCMVSTDDECFTFNRHINRLPAIQEHRMIRAALAKGAPESRIAAVLNMDVKSIRQRADLLNGVAPEAATLLKNRQVTHKIFSILKKMKPMRQIEAVEMMVAANKFTATHAEMILFTTKPEGRVDGVRPKKKDKISDEDLNRMEREMDRLRQDCQVVEDGAGDTMLSLVVAKGFMIRLLRNENIRGHLKRFHGDVLRTLEMTMEAISADFRATERE